MPFLSPNQQRQSTEGNVWNLVNMQNVLNHVLDGSSHLTRKRRQIFF